MRVDEAVELADCFLRSGLAADSSILSLDGFYDWLREQRSKQRLERRRIPFAELDEWEFDGNPCRLAHRSGRFFSIEGLRTQTDFGPVQQWDQPIINQPEIGILGIITRIFGGLRHFLMQAKIEPGNVNGVQLSPTEQATRSNFTRVHGGYQPFYHEYFVDRTKAKVLVDMLQGEQGSRFFRKCNRNMIVEIDHDIPIRDGFCWLTLGQIKRLLKHDNLVNMDARSVLSCIPTASLAGAPYHSSERDRFECHGFAQRLVTSLRDRHSALHTESDILNWLTDLRCRYSVKLERRPLDQLDGWRKSDDRIYHEGGRYFSVIALEVEAPGREVRRWKQPLFEHTGPGLNGFLLRPINGVLHFLVRACLYPGNREIFELGSTVSRSNAEEYFGRLDAPPFLDYFNKPSPDRVRYAGLQSEEGGRFYHYQNRYVILELPATEQLQLPENFCWMTLGQIEDFVRHGYFNIEGRNLLSCLDVSADPV